MLEPWRTGMPDRPALPVPPQRMAPWRDGRPLKRWWWVGGFAQDVIFCVAQARIAGIPVSWWAVWDRTNRTLLERTVKRTAFGLTFADGPVEFALGAQPGIHVETISPHGPSYIWTKKTPVHLTGRIRALERTFEVDTWGLRDDSAGYHARHTNWRWQAGSGTTSDGRPAVFNLVEGLHDAPGASEQTLWVDGEPRQVTAHALEFTQETARVHKEDRFLIATDYEQPFGAFAGSIDGVRIVGSGVTERHAARW